MTKFFILAALVFNVCDIGLQIERRGDLCPFVCRVDANGFRPAWYETNLPYLHNTLWVSPQQLELQRTVWVHRSELPLSVDDPRISRAIRGEATVILKIIGEDK